MIETKRRHASACGVAPLRLALVVVSLSLMVGCAGSDDKDDDGNTATPTVPSAGTPTRPPSTATPTVAGVDTPTLAPGTATSPPGTATPSPTAPLPDMALAACQKLAGCGQCFLNERGTCLAPEQCATRLTEDEARCVNSAAGCGATALGDCLTIGCGGDGSGDCE